MKHKLYSILFGLFIIATAVWLVATPNPYIRFWLTSMDNFIYDQRLKYKLNTKSPAHYSSPVVIIDIDEKSFVEQGDWPWPRAKFAQLVNTLDELGAKVIAFTIVFSDKTDASATTYLQKVQAQKSQDKETIQVLNRLVYLHEGDDLFVKAVAKSQVVLGMIFNQTSKYTKGLLPSPAAQINDPIILKQLVVPSFSSYFANYASLSQAAGHTGFVTGIVDQDGIIRRAPLLALYKDGIYFSLALEAVKLYQQIATIDIEFVPIGDKEVVNKLILDGKRIYTDESGSILIPYQGYMGYFPYYSASDILNHRISKEKIEGKLVFVGTSVMGLSDRRPTPFMSLFPNVEIQANIAQSLLGNFTPYTPNWGKGVEIGLIILLGSILAVILPFLRVLPIVATLIITVFGVLFTYIWFWDTKSIIFSISVPIITIFLLTIINLILGFLFESWRRETIFKTLTKYVPLEYAKKVTEYPHQASFEGEERLVTILFTDIRHFTKISESLDDMKLKDFLNQLFTPLTEIIISQQGTIDKYVGDMIMAYWGAPKEDALHVQHALDAALAMQEKTESLQESFKKFNLPSIRIGIGINTGKVNAGEVGTDIRRSYTIIGDSVNMASRLEELSKFYRAKIVVGEKTYYSSDDYVFRYLDRVAVKGKKKPSHIYELLCRKDNAPQELIVELNSYREALYYYDHQEWKKAYQKFMALIEKYPNVKIYSILLDRIKGFLFTET